MYDYLILGGGSAGCVLAARLTEDAGKTVCLVEAGRDLTQASMPADIRSRYPGRAYLDTRNIWQRLQARMSAPAAPRRYEQARVLGGGSAINALMANRGAPADYDEWDALGATGWNWAQCLPYFRKLETDRDLDGPLHGAHGPLCVRRASADRLSPFVRGVLGALERRGYPQRIDQNGQWEDGAYVGVIAVSAAGERIPTSICYLDEHARARPNLTVHTGALAERVIFDGRRAIGADVRLADGERRTLHAQRVIVSMGAIHSPALLMRSGVGPVDALAAYGIGVVAARDGVGRNLMEHPSIAVSAFLPREMRTPFPDEHHEQAVIRYSSGLPGTPAGDMHGAILSRSGWHSIGYRLGTMFFWVNKSYSRGCVRLASAHADREPAVEFSMLSDPRDLERLKDAVRFGAHTLADPALAPRLGPIFPSSYSPRVAAVAEPGKLNATQRGALSALLDVAGPLRGALIARVITQGISLDALLADDAALTEFVIRSVGGTWHPSGTCRMGAPNDPLAVTAPDGTVYGVEGLTVCDASLMPSIPCANTNVPTIMIAERIADMLRGRPVQ
ncbi:GMC family oxidoreductase N-terminal domain-containing protein [Trinickia caryophylli]|uniref:GMC family oxidoreductase n=1 Tax=Trinickia caryophylli TaxID=28094 RepID=UPI000A164545|nr:GMC family oxidoreductase N-terminal domain-containing protein [Trinickia caryophylli]PMS12076.1 sorbosone dehydrogenase [Trinickia caryophylli]TRX18618.1 sorbosone dehydrogenase [Trinickia caryophylli]WQE10589.1 GMC family oxidoreductase N-terminal domain-containing protein [Trinickia caryophylli]GLU32951.1 glucose dehydrogenase [Trinickia caryophylli]